MIEYIENYPAVVIDSKAKWLVGEGGPLTAGTLYVKGGNHIYMADVKDAEDNWKISVHFLPDGLGVTGVLTQQLLHVFDEDKNGPLPLTWGYMRSILEGAASKGERTLSTFARVVAEQQTPEFIWGDDATVKAVLERIADYGDPAPQASPAFLGVWFKTDWRHNSELLCKVLRGNSAETPQPGGIADVKSPFDNAHYFVRLNEKVDIPDYDNIWRVGVVYDVFCPPLVDMFYSYPWE
jgi:hypothetical protein